MSLICLPKLCYNVRMVGLDYNCVHEIFIPKEVCWNEFGTSCMCSSPDEILPNCTEIIGDEGIIEMLKEIVEEGE